MMTHFRHIDYSSSLEIFSRAERSGRRLKFGDITTSRWLQKENIKLDDIKAISQHLPDSRIFIIGEGETEGFYIYSQKQETCLKFEAPILSVE